MLSDCERCKVNWGNQQNLSDLTHIFVFTFPLELTHNNHLAPHYALYKMDPLSP